MNKNKYREKKTGKIVDVESKIFELPTLIHFIYQDGKHIDTVQYWAFRKQYEEIKENDSE